jgi:putative endonuclease
MSKNKNKEIGLEGENFAAMFLMKQGFNIVERNYTQKFGEVDIIAEKSGVIHFIEVKSVSHETFLNNSDKHRPEDNVHNLKINKIEKIADMYMSNSNLRYKPFQIDFIGVTFLKGNIEPFVEYIPNANF